MAKYTEIKIGRKIHEIKDGDYILDNNHCLQFCAGDKRGLKYERFTSYSNLPLPKNITKQIDLNLLTKKKYKSQFGGEVLTRYYF